MPVKILHICFSNAWGGLEKYSVSLAVWQKQRGHDVQYVCRTGTTLEKELLSSNIPVRPYDPVRYIDVRVMWRLRRHIVQNGFSVVHAHHSEDLGIIVPAIMGIKNVNLFFSLHMIVPGPKKDIYHRMEYKKVRKIFALGEEGMISARKNLPIEPDRVMELPYGLETEIYRPGKSKKLKESLGLGPEGILLGILSRLEPLKGQMEAVRAMPAILANYPNAHMVMAGDETVHLRGIEKKRIEAEIERLRLGDKVTILPYQRDVPELLRGLDVFILPSHYESYSISVIEAKLCGVPVVAAESGGIPQNLGYGEYGVLVKPKDAASLAGGVIKTLDDMPAAKKRAEKARENALKRYDRERILSIVEKEYQAAERAG